MIRHNQSVRGTWLEPETHTRARSVPSFTLNPCMPWPPAVPGTNVPRSVERVIAARWRWWVPWVRMHLLRQRQSDPTVNAKIDSPESRRLCQRHREHMLDLLREGISMRTIRRHRLDDPRLTDDLRAMLVDSAKARQSKAWFRRPEEQRAEDRLATLIKLGPVDKEAAATLSNNESSEAHSRTAPWALDPPALKEAVQAIRRLVCEHFYLRDMRDPELTVRTNRRSYVLPRQIAMYIARQATGASLKEIGREFGGRHHSTVLHSINKIEALRRTDEALNRTITRLVGAVVAQT